MKLGFFVNDVASEKPAYTTTRLAAAALGREHEVWYIGAGDFACDADDGVRARAWRAPAGVTDLDAVLAGAADDDRERLTVDDLDVLVLRNDPADDLVDRPWAQAAGIQFGDLASRRGVTVVNDPVGLGRAQTKLYLEHFPRAVRPTSLITRDLDEVRAFVAERGGTAVLKPLQGSGGSGVFIVHPEDEVNLDQMVEALARDGYLIAQEHLPEASEGDTRFFLLEGRPLESEGTYAAFRRVSAEGEARSNMRVGGTVEPAMVDDAMLELVEQVRPRLVEDGIFLAGLDIAAGRLLEVNVFSPGGLGSVQRMTGVDFAPVLVEALERIA
jgi:glutathione synthase